jgi:hypothetical protein
MDEYTHLKTEKTAYEKARDDKYKSDSRSRLGKILQKKIETTMIGALSSIESHFSHLWEGEMTPEKQALFDTYQKIRSEILDKGNAQKRNVDAELNQYEVRWLRYSMTIPVKPAPQQ